MTIIEEKLKEVLEKSAFSMSKACTNGECDDCCAVRLFTRLEITSSLMERIFYDKYNDRQQCIMQAFVVGFRAAWLYAAEYPELVIKEERLDI